MTSTYGEFAGIVIDIDNINNVGTIIKNNIVYSSTSEPLVHVDAGPLVGVELNNNIYFSTTNSTPFRFGRYPSEVDYNFDSWKSNTVNDTISKFADPLFIGTVGSVDPLKYYPSAGSPIKDFAQILNAFQDDSFALNRGEKWDAGALERGALIEPPPAFE